MDLAETDNIDEESFQQSDREAQNSPEELNNFSELDEELEIAESKSSLFVLGINK